MTLTFLTWASFCIWLFGLFQSLRKQIRVMSHVFYMLPHHLLPGTGNPNDHEYLHSICGSQCCSGLNRNLRDAASLENKTQKRRHPHRRHRRSDHNPYLHDLLYGLRHFARRKLDHRISVYVAERPQSADIPVVRSAAAPDTLPALPSLFAACDQCECKRTLQSPLPPLRHPYRLAELIAVSRKLTAHCHHVRIPNLSLYDRLVYTCR